MCPVRRNECRTGTNAASNAATDPGPWRSNETTRTGTDSGNSHAGAKSGSASGDTANTSDRAAGNSHPGAKSAGTSDGSAGNYCDPNSFGNAVASSSAAIALGSVPRASGLGGPSKPQWVSDNWTKKKSS